jgi:hypothetical protein
MGLKLATYFYLTVRLRMSGTKPPLPYTPSGCEHGNLTFLLLALF